MIFGGKPARPVVHKTLTMDCSCRICEFTWEIHFMGSLSEPDPPQPPCPNCGMGPEDAPARDESGWHWWQGPVQCFVCDHKWRGVIEIPASLSIPMVSLQCGQCGGMTGMPAEVFHDNQP